MVLFAGLLLGIAQNSMGLVGESTATMSIIHPHLILFIFIPVLLFESAFNSDWFVFKKALVNILVLAGPGVVWVINLGFTHREL
jgi:NhaP-type Na+/H+ or K+/H+ antiporter